MKYEWLLSGVIGIAVAATTTHQLGAILDPVNASVYCRNISGCLGDDFCAALSSVDGCTMNCLGGGVVNCPS